MLGVTCRTLKDITYIHFLKIEICEEMDSSCQTVEKELGWPIELLAAVLKTL